MKTDGLRVVGFIISGTKLHEKEEVINGWLAANPGHEIVDTTVCPSPGSSIVLAWYREVSQPPVVQEGESVSFQDAKQVAMERFERNYLLRLLEDSDYHLGEAARRSGVDRPYIRELLKKHGLELAALRAKPRP